MVLALMLFIAVWAYGWFWLIYTDRLETGQRVLAIAVLFAIIAVLLAVTSWIQAHRRGGWRQYRSFGRAVAKNGVLPRDADIERWRPRLARLLTSTSSHGLRVVWTWFGVVFAVAPQVAQGYTNPILLTACGALGVIVGLVASRFVITMTRRRLDNARRLLEQIDDELAGRPA